VVRRLSDLLQSDGRSHPAAENDLAAGDRPDGGEHLVGRGVLE